MNRHSGENPAAGRASFLTVNLAVLLFGLAGLFARWISLPALYITFGRVFISSITLAVYLKVRGESLRPGVPAASARAVLLRLFLAGAVLAVHWWTFLESIKRSTVAVGTITFAAFPLFVILLEPLVFHTKLSVRSLFTAVVLMIGVFITLPSFSFEDRMVQGIAIGLFSALCYAVLTIMNKQFTGTVDSTHIAFCEQASAALVLLPALLLSAKKAFPDESFFSRILRISPHDLLLLVFLGAVTTALAHTLFIRSLESLPARIAGICSAMETVYSIFFAMILLGEIPSAREWAGAAVILSAVLFTELHGEQDPPTAPSEASRQ